MGSYYTTIYDGLFDNSKATFEKILHFNNGTTTNRHDHKTHYLNNHFRGILIQFKTVNS